MPDENHDLRREVALFRFRLIGPLVHLPAGSQELAAGLRAIAASEHEIPGSRRPSVALGTLREWLRRYRRGGFEALHPKGRSDRHQSRSLPAEVDARDRRRFSWSLANEMWQKSERSDFCHYGNPAVMGPRPRNPQPVVVLSPDRSP